MRPMEPQTHEFRFSCAQISELVQEYTSCGIAPWALTHERRFSCVIYKCLPHCQLRACGEAVRSRGSRGGNDPRAIPHRNCCQRRGIPKRGLDIKLSPEALPEICITQGSSSSTPSSAIRAFSYYASRCQTRCLAVCGYHVECIRQQAPATHLPDKATSQRRRPVAQAGRSTS